MTENEGPGRAGGSEQVWLTLAELTVAAQAKDYQAVAGALDALQGLVGWPSAALEVPAQLLGAAVREALSAEAIHQRLTVRILAAETGAAYGQSEAAGWGFFIVCRRWEPSSDALGVVGATVELYLYREGGATP